ncbi:DegT/DnrJ/EryC1/StrS family aminotransferase [Luteibacter sp.]|uniref:DegT/DnrJ/EryC1/StrS family aminotransferase n=1 Tax=Luteibacter sp. TaxID=1886636 RepID=UPI003F7D5BBD
MTTPSKIHYTKPSITALETEYAADAAANGWGERCYDYIERFEAAFSMHVGTRFAIATSSATGALHLGMAALGIGPGDEVILADINWIASAAPIVHLGAKPVLVDIDPVSWCIEPGAVAAAITPRTKAILAVHLYGNMCDLDTLRRIGDAHGIPVIEDAAEAVGSSWHEHPAGSVGIFGAFSFHGTKTITTGEGGMFVTQDEALYQRVLTLSNHGRARGEKRQFWPAEIGYKYKMSNIQAAIGCAQLERVDQLIAKKRDIFSYYHDALSDTGVAMNPEPSGTRNGYWMPTVVVPQHIPFDRDGLIAHFRDANIDGRVFFWPLSTLPMFPDVTGNTVSRSIAPRALNLPSYHDLTAADQDRVIRCLRSYLGANS